MLPEFRQPEINLPVTETDPQAWIKILPAQIEWLRFVCPQLDFNNEKLDITKMVSGMVMAFIIGDHSNVFPKGNVIPSSFTLSQASHQLALDWELSVSELPQKIKNVLLPVFRGQLLTVDWADQAVFQQAKLQWTVVEGRIRRIINRDSILDANFTYYDAAKRDLRLDALWTDFLTTKGFFKNNI